MGQNTAKSASRSRPSDLDDIDRAILRTLQRDGRITNAKLAAAVRISPASSLQRVRKLRRAGVIRGFAALLDPAAIGRPITVLVSVSLREHGRHRLEEFAAAIRDLEEVQACWHIAGESDFILKVVAADIAGYERFVSGRLSVLDNIGRVRSSFCLRALKDETALPV